MRRDDEVELDASKVKVALETDITVAILAMTGRDDKGETQVPV